jgi:hypothetical protein
MSDGKIDMICGIRYAAVTYNEPDSHSFYIIMVIYMALNTVISTALLILPHVL